MWWLAARRRSERPGGASGAGVVLHAQPLPRFIDQQVVTTMASAVSGAATHSCSSAESGASEPAGRRQGSRRSSRASPSLRPLGCQRRSARRCVLPVGDVGLWGWASRPGPRPEGSVLASGAAAAVAGRGGASVMAGQRPATVVLQVCFRACLCASACRRACSACHRPGRRAAGLELQLCAAQLLLELRACSSVQPQAGRSMLLAGVGRERAWEWRSCQRACNANQPAACSPQRTG